jgi:hypothetical protein
MRWSEEKLAEFQARHGIIPQVDPPKGKLVPRYRNEKLTTPEGTFDSKGEYDRWCKLKMLQKGGVISDLRRQVKFVLAPPVILEGKQKPALRYFADFVYLQCGLQVVEDFKSPATAAESSFRIKLHLMKSVHDIDVQLVVNNKKR